MKPDEYIRRSLSQLMTGVAPRGRLVFPMAIHAPFHLEGLLKRYERLLRDISMASRTLHLRCRVRTVAEEDEARQFVNELQRDLPLIEIGMAGLTLRQSREARSIRPLRIRVAEGALLLQRRVLLVIERPVFTP
jgi:hypothetical protein